MSGKQTGKIKRIVEDRGFGFIKPDSGGADIFFHCSGLKNRRFDEVDIDDQVEFSTESGEKGPRAKDIMVV